MEAMAMELPILSTRHAGIPELVEHGVNGLLCEERDLETYSRQMEEIATWSSKPENRLRIEKEYNKTTHNTLLESLYRQAITRR
jgi:glycosyltransferase involved in cell wall biosynthesis